MPSDLPLMGAGFRVQGLGFRVWISREYRSSKRISLESQEKAALLK